MKGVVKRSIAINNYKTSVSLDDKFWSGIR